MTKAPNKSTKRKRAKSGKTRVNSRYVTMWARIRNEYETTDVSIAELAKRYNMKSRTSVVRMRDKEGWQRDVKSMAANIVTEDILSEQMRAEASAVEGDVMPALPDTRSLPPPHYGVTGADRVAQARALAELQRKQVVEEQAVAELGMLVSAQVLRSLHIILIDPDPDAIRREAQRLGAISDKQESFSSLLRAAIGSFKEAVSLRRRAIGLEAPSVPKGSASLPPQASEIPDEVGSVLPKLDIDSLEQLRLISEKLERMRNVDR